MIRVCLHCEGRGTVRVIRDIAGSYDIEYCLECRGTGKEAHAVADAACVATVKRIALGGITITEAMRIADAALVDVQRAEEQR